MPWSAAIRRGSSHGPRPAADPPRARYPSCSARPPRQGTSPTATCLDCLGSLSTPAPTSAPMYLTQSPSRNGSAVIRMNGQPAHDGSVKRGHTARAAHHPSVAGSQRNRTVHPGNSAPEARSAGLPPERGRGHLAPRTDAAAVRADDDQRHERQAHQAARGRRAVRRPVRNAAMPSAPARLPAGSLQRRLEWSSPSGRTVRIASTRMVSLMQRAVAAITAGEPEDQSSGRTDG
jgi:Glycosyl hydrolase family 65, N-terminal domain